MAVHCYTSATEAIPRLLVFVQSKHTPVGRFSKTGPDTVFLLDPLSQCF